MANLRSWLGAMSPLIVAGLLSACATGLVNPQVPPPGSQSFKEGYHNGCTSGFSDGGRDGYETSYVKDGTRYASEADYRTGWDQGYSACFEEQKYHPKYFGF